MPNTYTESDQSSVQEIPSAVKSVATLLGIIERDLPTMDTRTILILSRSLRLGIVLLERATTPKDLIKTGKKT